jgi:hypothetical protein
MSLAGNTICTAFFLVAAWHLVRKAMTLNNAGEISETLRIIYWPVILAVALGCLSLSLTLFTGVLGALFPPKDGTP